MPKTAKQLRDEVIARIWPDGAPENLALRNVNAPHIRAPYELSFDETLAEISKHVPCERTRNVNVIAFAETFFSNGMTVVPAPRGIISRVYTIDADGFESRVFYDQQEWPWPERWARRLTAFLTSPVNTGVIPVLPLGFKRAEDTTDRDDNGNLFGRAASGVWGLNDEKVWITPWIQSDESLVIEWRGIKKTWGDNDVVTEDQDYIKAVFLYMKYCHERDYGDKQEAMLLHQRLPDGRFVGTFDEALADLIRECDERTRLQRRDPEENDTMAAILLTGTGGGGGSTSTTVTLEVSDFMRQADYADAEPDWTPSGGLGFAFDTSTSRFWQYYSGAWH